MKSRSAIAALSAAAIVGSGALALSSTADASAATASHTLKFVVVTQKELSLSQTVGAEQGIVTGHAGKTIGFAVANLAFSLKTGKATANFAFDVSGGLLYARFVISPKSTTLHGVVTGGAGQFKDARGTISATSLNKTDTKAAFVVNYRT